MIFCGSVKLWKHVMSDDVMGKGAGHFYCPNLSLERVAVVGSTSVGLSCSENTNLLCLYRSNVSGEMQTIEKLS